MMIGLQRFLASLSLFLVSCDSFVPLAFKDFNQISRLSLEMSTSSEGGIASPTRGKKRKLYSFSEARRIARGHGFESRQEFIEYECAGAYQLPKNADEVWKSDWTSWDDFLGIPLSFEEARQVARSLGLASHEDYLKLIEEKQMDESDLSSRLPYRPDLRYKKEWTNWHEFLGL
jgi:hypothetical protein